MWDHSKRNLVGWGTGKQERVNRQEHCGHRLKGVWAAVSTLLPSPLELCRRTGYRPHQVSVDSGAVELVRGQEP